MCSIEEFVTKKIKIYKKFESASSQLACEKVFYELPFNIIQQFVLRNTKLTEQALINFVRFDDFVINSHYRQLVDMVDASTIVGEPSAPQRSVSQTNSGQASGLLAGINTSDPRLFLDLENDLDDELTEEEEMESLAFPPISQLNSTPPPAPSGRGRKRANSAHQTRVRKQKTPRKPAKKKA